MLNFGTSNVTNCEEREISFPLLILSLESKKRHGCETPPLLFFMSLLIFFYSSLFTFHLLSKVRIDLDECRNGKGNSTEEHDKDEEAVIT